MKNVQPVDPLWSPYEQLFLGFLIKKYLFIPTPELLSLFIIFRKTEKG